MHLQPTDLQQEHKMEKGQSVQHTVTENWVFTHRRMKPDPYPTPPIPYTYKKQTKYIKHLYVRPEIVELLQENTGGKLHDTGPGNDFMGKPPVRMATIKKEGLPPSPRRRQKKNKCW